MFYYIEKVEQPLLAAPGDGQPHDFVYHEHATSHYFNILVFFNTYLNLRDRSIF